MKKKDLTEGLLIDDFTPLLTALQKGQIQIVKHEDPGVDYAEEYRKQTGRDLETGEYITQ